MPSLPAKVSGLLIALCSACFAQTADIDSLTSLPQLDYSPSLIGIIFKLLLSMVLIVGLIYLSTFLIKKVNTRAAGGGTVGDTIKIIGRTFLSPKQALYLVKIGERYAVLGATENNINMIRELSGSEAEYFKNTKKNPAGPAGSKFAAIFKGLIKQ